MPWKESRGSSRQKEDVASGGSGRQPSATRDVVVADGRQGVERETDDAVSQAQELSVPGEVSGRIGHEGDVDFYRFTAKQGQRIFIDCWAWRIELSIPPPKRPCARSPGRRLCAALLPLPPPPILFRRHRPFVQLRFPKASTDPQPDW